MIQGRPAAHRAAGHDAGDEVEDDDLRPLAMSHADRTRLVLRSLEFATVPAGVRALSRPLMRDPFARQPRLFAHGRPILFIHVPKTAGSSVGDALGVTPGHVPLSRYEAADPERYARSCTVAFCRSPWTRLASAFFYVKSARRRETSPDAAWAHRRIRDLPDFAALCAALESPRRARALLRMTHFRPQIDWLRDAAGRPVAPGFLGRFETVAADAARLFALTGIRAELPHMRNAVARDDRGHWTADMIEAVRRAYAADIDAFGYEGAAPATGDPV